MILGMDAIIISEEEAKALVRAIQLASHSLDAEEFWERMRKEHLLGTYNQLRKSIDSVSSLVLEDYER